MGIQKYFMVYDVLRRKITHPPDMLDKYNQELKVGTWLQNQQK